MQVLGIGAQVPELVWQVIYVEALPSFEGKAMKNDAPYLGNCKFQL